MSPPLTFVQALVLLFVLTFTTPTCFSYYLPCPQPTIPDIVLPSLSYVVLGRHLLHYTTSVSGLLLLPCTHFFILGLFYPSLPQPFPMPVLPLCFGTFIAFFTLLPLPVPSFTIFVLAFSNCCLPLPAASSAHMIFALLTLYTPFCDATCFLPPSFRCSCFSSSGSTNIDVTLCCAAAYTVLPPALWA